MQRHDDHTTPEGRCTCARPFGPGNGPFSFNFALSVTIFLFLSCASPPGNAGKEPPPSAGASTEVAARHASPAPASGAPGADAAAIPAMGPPAAASSKETPAPEQTGEDSRRIVREGIAVEFSVERIDAGDDGREELVEGDDVRVEFRISDTATGTPATTLEPAAWIHEANPQESCKQKITSFLSGKLAARAEIDLNTFYVLALNDDSSISVVDPLFSYGGSRLLAMAVLNSPGEDWVLSPDQRRLFVTMPRINQVAVVDTATWKVTKNIETGVRPMRAVLQPDGKYLWVGSDGVNSLDLTSGVTVIDATKLERVTQIPTGVGHHEIAFSPDDHYAFVTNGDAATVSIIDIRQLEKVKDIPCGQHPVAVDFSTLGQAAYVVSEAEGTILVIDGRSLEVESLIEAMPGLGALRFAPGGRLGFVVNRLEDTVQIIDASLQRIVQTGDVGPGPDQVTFTENIAYVRSLGSEIVLMIPLDQVGTEGAPIPVIDFTGGHVPFGQADNIGIAAGIVPAPGGTAVLVANPVDQAIYYYREGMAAPMGHFQNYKVQPRAVLVVDRSLNEVEPGVYATDIRLPRGGEFDVAFFMDSPRVVHCFSLEVLANPDTPQKDTRPPMLVKPLVEKRTFRPGEHARLRFEVRDPTTDEPRVGLKDFGVVAYAGGNWQRRQWAQAVSDGVYEIEFTPPRAGAYYLDFQCPSLKVQLTDLPSLVLRVENDR